MIKHKGLVIHPHELAEYWVNRFLLTDLNLLGLHPEGGINGGRSVEEAVAWSKLPETNWLLGHLIEKGVDIEYEMHALSWLLPRDLFSAQPEWFRMDEHGNRVNDYHFCHSNPEALEYISERSVELAKVFAPTTHRYNFWVDDGTNVVCHCPKCKETGYSDSDAALNIYNAMLAGIRSVDSKAQQCYLAYFGTSPAPMKIKPAEGIFLEFAPMNRDPFKSLHDPTAPPDKNIKTAGYLDELLKTFGTKNAKVLDYWLDNSWNSGWKKPVKKARFSFDAARDDIAFYNEMGIEAVTTFACFLGEEYYELYGEHADILGYANAFHT